MGTQNYKNHARFDPKYHFVLFAIVILTLVGAVRYLWVAVDARLPLYPPMLLLMLSLVVFGLYALVRIYPLQAQDRAIRAEENLRHFVLTGKLLNPRLSVKQIVALRFAPDEEFPALAARAAAEDMAPAAIKQAIVNWKADWDRV